MSDLIELNKKSCIPCQGGTPALDIQARDNLLKSLNHQLSDQWNLNEHGHLYKKYVLRNFREAMAFAHKITDIAEQENHHPDLMISYGVCIVEIWTHKIQGLTESDFILAAKIEFI